nr:MarR family transcriptional regulator [uncultured Agathobaculum sp.]
MLEEELHYLLMLAFHSINREVIARVRKDGLLPGQPKVLEYLHEHDGCTQKQLGDGCVLDKSTVTGLLARMDRQGLVCKRTAPDDRRVALACLTEEGRAQAVRVRQGCAAVDTLAWGDITPAQRAAFLQTLRIIILNLQNEGGKNGK